MQGETFVLGMDIGGTNIRLGLVNNQKELFHFEIGDMQEIASEDTVESLTRILKKYISKYRGGFNIVGISAGFPSTIDKERKVIYSTPNIKGLNNILIVDVLEKALNIPVYIDKDVNMILQYDMFQKDIPDRGVCTAFYIGPGLGNAISINGDILGGKNGAAAELGHIPSRDVDGVCGCGNTSCVELFASGKYLSYLCDNELDGVYIKDVFKKYSDHPVIKKYVNDLAIPVSAEINILDPDYIIIGGGVVQMPYFPKDFLEQSIKKYVRKPYPLEGMEFLYSVPGQENGVIGAGIYGFKQASKQKH